MKTKPTASITLFALASACFGQGKRRPSQLIAPSTRWILKHYSCIYPAFPTQKLLLEQLCFGDIRGRSSIPRSNSTPDYIVLGNGFGEITEHADWCDLGANLRKVDRTTVRNTIGYEISGTEFRVRARSLMPPYPKRCKQPKRHETVAMTRATFTSSLPKFRMSFSWPFPAGRFDEWIEFPRR
jgi:hypothetical protein